MSLWDVPFGVIWGEYLVRTKKPCCPDPSDKPWKKIPAAGFIFKGALWAGRLEDVYLLLGRINYLQQGGGEKTINLVRFSTECDRLVITVKNKSFPAGELCRRLNKNKCNVRPAKENKSKQCGNWIEMFFWQQKNDPFTVEKVNGLI